MHFSAIAVLFLNLLLSFTQAVLALALVAAVAADSPPARYAPAPSYNSYDYPDAAPVYNFGYNVYNQENYEHQVWQKFHKRF